MALVEKRATCQPGEAGSAGGVRLLESQRSRVRTQGHCRTTFRAHCCLCEEREKGWLWKHETSLELEGSQFQREERGDRGEARIPLHFFRILTLFKIFLTMC